MSDKIKTSVLTGPALDWAVAKCAGEVTEFGSDGITFGFKLNGELKVFAKGWAASMCWSPSTDWSQGGPLIEQERITVQFGPLWTAVHSRRLGRPSYGPTPLIAAMRCFVASKLGDEVDVPDELCQTTLAAQQPAAVDVARFERAPCYLCGYNGPGYYRPDTHPCAAKYHAAQQARRTHNEQ